ncbi:Aminodeoxychorismate lyase [Ciborinia camelliae]|nr:Aminodeoxychorismate lyase [Ciborinia camelliae]
MSPEPAFQLFTSLRYDPQLLQSPQNTHSWPLEHPSPSPFYMLPHHRDRLLNAALRFEWPNAISAISGPAGFQNILDALSQNIDTNSPTPLRVRIVLDHAGNLTVESSPVPAVPLSNLFPGRLPPPNSIPEPKPQVSPLTGGVLTLGPTDSLPSDPTKASPPWSIIPDPERTAPSPYTSFKTTSRTMYNRARERAQIHQMSDRKEVLLISSSEEGEKNHGGLPHHALLLPRWEMDNAVGEERRPAGYYSTVGIGEWAMRARHAPPSRPSPPPKNVGSATA